MPIDYRYRGLIIDKENDADDKSAHRKEHAAEIRRLWCIPMPTAVGGETELALRERVKELNCLYGISRLAERHRRDLEGFLRELVDFLPPSWQYADQACAEIAFDSRVFLSRNFRETPWRQSAPVFLNGLQVGECVIYYTDEYPEADEGPFLKEERALLNAVAERIGSIAAQISADLELEEANEQLRLERQALKETNTALKVILSRNEHQKNDIRRDIRHNMEKVILPIIGALEVQLPGAPQKYIALLKTNLEELTSPFMSGLAAGFPSLSPTEVLICNMIKNGLTSKEIAETRGIAPATVNHHREKIRRKLGITNREVNLATFLQSNSVEAD